MTAAGGGSPPVDTVEDGNTANFGCCGFPPPDCCVVAGINKVTGDTGIVVVAGCFCSAARGGVLVESNNELFRCFSVLGQYTGAEDEPPLTTSSDLLAPPGDVKRFAFVGFLVLLLTAAEALIFILFFMLLIWF